MSICAFIGLSARQVYRWENPQPKPEKTISKEPREEAALQELRQELRGLTKKPRRLQEASQLHQKYTPQLSRRTVQHEINQAKNLHLQKQKEEQTRIRWKMPMLCWAMDDTHLFTEENGVKIYLNNIKDLGSQFVLPSIIGPLFDGATIARNLRRLFKTFGAPLFLKRDNGPNLNAQVVDNVLEEFGVVPLNSPAYYSQYNGSIENSNGCVKRSLKTQLNSFYREVTAENLPLLARLACHEENHKQKRSLGGKLAAEVFWNPRLCADLSLENRQVLELEIREQEKLMAQKISSPTNKEKSRIKRRAIEAILQSRGYITINETKGKVLTN